MKCRKKYFPDDLRVVVSELGQWIKKIFANRKPYNYKEFRDKLPLLRKTVLIIFLVI